MWFVVWTEFDTLAGHRESEEHEHKHKLSVVDHMARDLAMHEARLVWTKRTAKGYVTHKRPRRGPLDVETAYAFPREPRLVYEERF